MSSRYIGYPIPVDARDLIQRAFAYIQAKNPNWEPSEGQLDTWILEATASEGADIGTLASQVPKSIFRYFGETLFGVQAVDETFATVSANFYLTDSLGHTITAGTQVGIRNSVGDLIPFTVVSDEIVSPGNNQALGVLLVSAVGGSAATALGSVGGTVELIDPIIWIDHVTQVALTAGGQDAESDDEYLDRLSVQLQTMSPRPILARDFSILARNIAAVQRAYTEDGYNPYYNMLTANESSFETSVANHTGTNAALSNPAIAGGDGAKALGLTAASAADMSAQLDVAQAKAVRPGDVISAIAFFRTAVTARNVKVGIKWYTAANAVISTSYGATVADNAGGYTQASVTATAPPTAAKAVPVYFVTAPANAEVHYVDKALIGKGNISAWLIGPATATDQERMVTVYAQDENGDAIDASTKTALADYLESLRELNFIVNVGDPTVNLINVNVQFNVRSDYALGDVQSRVDDAIRTFLDPRYWGISATDNPNNPQTWENIKTIYYLELATVINNVPGVDRITLLQMAINPNALAAADLALNGQVPLPEPNTITVVGAYA